MNIRDVFFDNGNMNQLKKALRIVSSFNGVTMANGIFFYCVVLVRGLLRVCC